MADTPPPTLDEVIAEIEEQAEQASSELSWFSLQAVRRAVAPMESTVDALLTRLVNGVPESGLDALITKIKERRRNLPLTSEIYTEVVGVSKQILTFGAAGFAFSLGFADKVSLLPANVQRWIVILGIFYLELLATSIFVLLLYILQARYRYPFLEFAKIGNTWPFFYYSSISDETPRWPIDTAGMRMRAATLYAKDLTKFADRVISEQPREQLRVELQQYFLLIAFMGYVHQFSIRLTNTFLYGLTGSMTSLLVLIVLWSRT